MCGVVCVYFVRSTRFRAMVAEKQNLDLATKADVIRWVQADEMVSAAFLEAFMSTILRIKPDVKAKAAGPRPGCSGAGHV